MSLLFDFRCLISFFVIYFPYADALPPMMLPLAAIYDISP